MIITISTISQEFTKTGAEYLKITGITGDGKETTKSIFNNLKDKWPLLKENATLDFKLVKKGQFWNVEDINSIELRPSQPSDNLLPEDQKIIDEATRIKPAPQEIGMWWNNLGNRIGDGSLERDYPKSIVKIKSQYYSQMFKILGIEEAKGETKKAQTIQETTTTGQTETDIEVGGEEVKPKTIAEFLNHLKGMGIKAPRTWLAKEWEVPITEVLTLPKCQELYKKIKEKGMVK